MPCASRFTLLLALVAGACALLYGLICVACVGSATENCLSVDSSRAGGPYIGGKHSSAVTCSYPLTLTCSHLDAYIVTDTVANTRVRRVGEYVFARACVWAEAYSRCLRACLRVRVGVLV